MTPAEFVLARLDEDEVAEIAARREASAAWLAASAVGPQTSMATPAAELRRLIAEAEADPAQPGWTS